LRTYVFVVSPIISSLITGGLSWFLSGALVSAASFCVASAAIGALAGALISLNGLRGVSREIASLKEASVRASQAVERVKERPAIQDVHEVRELVTSLTRVLKTAEEVEAARNTALEKAVETASAALNEAARYVDWVNRKVTEAAKALAAVEGELEHGADSRD